MGHRDVAARPLPDHCSELTPGFLSGLTYTHGSTDRCPLVLISSLNHILDVFLKAQNLQHVPVYPIGAAC